MTCKSRLGPFPRHGHEELWSRTVGCLYYMSRWQSLLLTEAGSSVFPSTKLRLMVHVFCRSDTNGNQRWGWTSAQYTVPLHPRNFRGWWRIYPKAIINADGMWTGGSTMSGKSFWAFKKRSTQRPCWCMPVNLTQRQKDLEWTIQWDPHFTTKHKPCPLSEGKFFKEGWWILKLRLMSLTLSR